MRLVFEPNISVDGVTLDVPGYNGPHAGRGRPFEKDVADLLWGLSIYPVGRAVINAINRRGNRKLFIIPYVGAHPNALTNAVQWLDAIAPGQPSHARQRPGLGTGAGTDVRIRFTPWIFTSDEQLYFLNRHRPIPWFQIRGLNSLAAGNDPAEILLHELVHAATAMAGRETGLNPMQGGWDDEDEFRAIIVTDIYSSERGRPLRQQHLAGVSLDNPQPWQSDPYFKRLLGNLIAAMPDLAQELERIDTAFNPLRGSFDLPDAQLPG